MMPIQALRLRNSVSLEGTKLNLIHVFPASTFSVSSTTYVDWLDGSGGSPITRTYIKQRADTSILVSIGGTWQYNASAGLLTLGVNDGTNDYDVCAFLGLAAGNYRPNSGQRLITGLAAQTFTFTARAKIAAGSASCGSNGSGFLRVMEVMEFA